MITPFNEDNSIDWAGVHQLVEFYIRSGCTGIFTVCLSGEMYNLSDQEKIKLAQEVVTAVRGRVAVVAGGTFHDDVGRQADFVRQMYNTGVEAVVVIASVMCAAADSESVWRERVQQLLDRTGNIPLGLYECPKPYWRLLSPDAVKWCASTGRFWIHKDTCCSIVGIKAKLAALNTLPNSSFKFFNANMATLLDSIQLGGHGFCGIAANCYPHLIAWLCSNPTSPFAVPLQHHLSVCELVVANQYPQSAKLYLLQSEPGFQALPTRCRIGSFQFNEEEQIRLRHLHGLVEHVTQQLPKAL